MATANEELRNAFIRHQIFLQQAVGTISEDVLRILDASEADLLAQIRKQTSRSADRLTKANQVRLTRLQKSITSIRGRAWEKAEDEWFGEASKLLGEQTEFLHSAFETVGPTILDTTLVAPQLLNSLVRTHPFEGRTLKQWADTVKRADLARIMDQVKIGMVQGESSDQIARRIVGTVGQRGRNGVTAISRRNAQAITRTMVNDFSNQANQEFFQENRDLIKFEIYTATLDARTTPICQSLDGKKFPVGEGAVPPLHFACRSVRIPILDPDSMLTVDRPFKSATEKGLLNEFTRNNKLKRVSSRKNLPRGFKGKFDKFARKRSRQLTGTVPANLNYQEWLKTQSLSFQEQVLGKTKAKLFRDGGLTLDKFVDPRFHPVRISELRKLNAEAFKKAGLQPVIPSLDAKRLGVGQRATELLIEGRSVDEVLAQILIEFPEAKTKKASISWYKSQLKKKGIKTGTPVIGKTPPIPKTPPAQRVSPGLGPGEFFEPVAGKFNPVDPTKVLNDRVRDRINFTLQQGHIDADIITILEVEFPNLKGSKAIKRVLAETRKSFSHVLTTSAKNIPDSPLFKIGSAKIEVKVARLTKAEATLERNKLLAIEVDRVTRGNLGADEVRKQYTRWQKSMDDLKITVDPRIFQKTGTHQLREIFADTDELHFKRKKDVLGTFWHTNKIGLRTKTTQNTFIHEYFHHLDYTSLRTQRTKSLFTDSLLRPDIDQRKAESLRRTMKIEMGKARANILKWMDENPNNVTDPILSSELFQGKKIDFTKHWSSLFDIPNNASTFRPSNYALHSIEEWIAESGSLYFTNRAKLKLVAPETFKVIEEWLSGGVF